MSIRRKLDSLNDDIKKRLATDLEFVPKKTIYGPADKSVYAFGIRNDKISIPLFYACHALGLERPERKSFRHKRLKFTGKLRPLQKTVRKDAIKLLNRQGTCIISLYTGGGKTVTAIKMCISIGMPTMIIISRLILMGQWAESIHKFCPDAKIQKVSTKKKIDADADFYIVNAINVPKFGNAFDHIGMLIVDEVHLIGTEKLSDSLHYVHPRYAIGLSATPTRPDGMDKLLHAYFGENKVYRKLYRKHEVFKIKTGFKPEVKNTKRGKLDWNTVLNSQAGDDKRNNLILDLIEFFPKRNFLILCKRVNQGNVLVEGLKSRNVDVTSLIGIKKHFDSSSRVLIATVQKAGVGFDHPKLDALIIAADLQEYFIQYLGRVFRTETVCPMILDLVDDFGVLKKHYYTRRRIYLDHGGTIKDFAKAFPTFLPK